MIKTDKTKRASCSINNWRYYNHAAIPTTAPHEEVDLAPINNGSVWKIPGHPLLARWTSDFDCGYQTNWWYIIKDQPIILDDLSSHSRKHIRQGLKKTKVEIIDNTKYAEELYEVSHAAFSKYENATNESSWQQFLDKCRQKSDSVFWGGFEKESGQLIAYCIVREKSDYVEVVTAKFNPNYLNTHISDVLYYTIINFYMIDKKKQYISSGERNINHHTNTQEYKERTLGYRKAYCKLNIKYKWPLNIVINCIYPFRNILKKYENNNIIHLIMGIMKMEEIIRSR